jgi:hypothetical protein
VLVQGQVQVNVEVPVQAAGAPGAATRPLRRTECRPRPLPWAAPQSQCRRSLMAPCWLMWQGTWGLRQRQLCPVAARVGPPRSLSRPSVSVVLYEGDVFVCVGLLCFHAHTTLCPFVVRAYPFLLFICGLPSPLAEPLPGGVFHTAHDVAQRIADLVKPRVACKLPCWGGAAALHASLGCHDGVVTMLYVARALILFLRRFG